MAGEFQGTVEDDLKSCFGFRHFLPGQSELIGAVLTRRDAFGLMPTGGGKSLTYQLPAMRLRGITIVVSPLIALMKDQVDAFNRQHAKRALAVAIHSGMTGPEVLESLGHIYRGRASLLYVAPERLEYPSFRERLQRLGPKLLVIDEVHCVSLWGHDFRPAYMRLVELVRDLRPCPVLALTSTATPKTREDIVRQLGLQDVLMFVAPLDRPNLFFRVVECRDRSDKKRRLLETVRKVGGDQSQIVYVGRRMDAEDLASFLIQEKIVATAYHAGMEARSRKRIQEQWLSGQRPVIVATIAFGMGIDNPHVRAVTHFQHPASIEAYYQEGGRAGRDGHRAECTILFSSRDKGLHHYFIRNRYPDEDQILDLWESVPATGCAADDLAALLPKIRAEQRNVGVSILLDQGFLRRDDDGLLRRQRKPTSNLRVCLRTMKARQNADYRRLEAIESYCREAECCRASLLRYLGEQLPDNHRCGNCSVCRPERQGSVRRSRAATPPRAPHAPRGRRPSQRDPVMWSSRSRSFTKGELVGHRVPREIGVSILKVVARKETLLSVSAVANVLKGSRSCSAVRSDPGLRRLPEFGASRGTTYDALVQDVLAMLAKGYLQWAPAGGKRLVLCSQGRRVLGLP